MNTMPHAQAGQLQSTAPTGHWHHDLLQLAARIFPGAIFWQSGQTKLDGWQLNDSAIYLFQEEFRLPLLNPELAAHLAAGAETIFPILLLLGLATRYAAFALLGMTAVIEVFVYPEAWPTHGTWAVAWLLLIKYGAGRISLDYWLQTKFGNRG